jgi:hypothetical protein
MTTQNTARAVRGGNVFPVVTVSKDGRSLEVKRPLDKRVTKVQVLELCHVPAAADARIGPLMLEDQSLTVTYGRRCWAEVSMRSLAVSCMSCD